MTDYPSSITFIGESEFTISLIPGLATEMPADEVAHLGWRMDQRVQSRN
jgi:hypothetical protein